MPASKTTKGTRNWLSERMAFPVALFVLADMGRLLLGETFGAEVMVDGSVRLRLA